MPVSWIEFPAVFEMDETVEFVDRLVEFSDVFSSLGFQLLLFSQISQLGLSLLIFNSLCFVNELVDGQDVFCLLLLKKVDRPIEAATVLHLLTVSRIEDARD